MIAPADPRHGSVAGYNGIPCHDACCRAAYSAWRKRWTHDRRNGLPRMLDATGCRRRVQALTALGWTVRAMADAAGVTHRTLWPVLTATTATRAKAERVAAVYDQLSMSLPPEQTHGEKVSASRARNRAARGGWPPPLAWDEGTIDDPAALPYRGRSRGSTNPERRSVDPVVVERALAGHRVHANQSERTEVLRRWVALQRSAAELGRIQGWNVGRDRRSAAA